MLNNNLSIIFAKIADMQELLQQNSFKVSANRKIARIIAEYDQDFAELAADDQLQNIDGIGQSAAARIKEYCQTGTITEYEELLEQIPSGVFDMLKINGLGPKSVSMLWREYDIDNIRLLLSIAEEGKLEKMPGFGKKKANAIISNVKFQMESGDRILLGRAIEIVEHIRMQIHQIYHSVVIHPVGSVRRCCETVGDIDLLAVTESPKEFLDSVLAVQGVKEVLNQTDTRASFLWLEPDSQRAPAEVELFTIAPASEHAALCFLTPSAAQRQLLCDKAAAKKLTLDHSGLHKSGKPIKCTSELAVYKKLGLPYILPTLQDTTEAQQAAIDKKLPEVVRLSDIRGDLHMHTTASDGRSSVDDLINAAMMLKYEYIAITDHSKSSVIANGQSTRDLLAQVERLHELDEQVKGLTLFAGCEVDILSDGSLDYDDDVLKQLDYITASIHSGMTGPGEKNTTRILKAMESPYVRCISHPTGRYIKYRQPMDLDMPRIFQQAVDTNTALEISSQPARLDLSAEHVRQAIEMGVKLAINTDAHEAPGLFLMSLGVSIAQKGWASKADIINTMPLKKFKAWLNA